MLYIYIGEQPHCFRIDATYTYVGGGQVGEVVVAKYQRLWLLLELVRLLWVQLMDLWWLIYGDVVPKFWGSVGQVNYTYVASQLRGCGG